MPNLNTSKCRLALNGESHTTVPTSKLPQLFDRTATEKAVNCEKIDTLERKVVYTGLHRKPQATAVTKSSLSADKTCLMKTEN